MDFKTRRDVALSNSRPCVYFYSFQHALLVGVPREKSNQISSMINFIRNIGGSIGIALIGAFITRATQQRESCMAGHLNHGNLCVRNMMEGSLPLCIRRG